MTFMTAYFPACKNPDNLWFHCHRNSVSQAPYKYYNTIGQKGDECHQNKHEPNCEEKVQAFYLKKIRGTEKSCTH